MVDLGVDWVGGGDRDFIEANLLLDGIILAPLSVVILDIVRLGLGSLGGPQGHRW